MNSQKSYSNNITLQNNYNMFDKKKGSIILIIITIFFLSEKILYIKDKTINRY